MRIETNARFSLLDAIQLLSESGLPFVGAVVRGDLVWPRFAHRHPGMLDKELEIVGGIETRKHDAHGRILEYAVVPTRDSSGMVNYVGASADTFYSLEVPER